MQKVPTVIAELAAALQQALPGETAQYRMAPIPRPGAERENRPRPDARHSGVLVLLYPHHRELHVPLILRPTYAGAHSGQVAFPGGGQEPQDVDVTATALREAWEEIGVPPEQVQVLGRLTPLYIRPSNYLVTPTVGWIPSRPPFCADPYEVERLLETPLVSLQDPANLRREVWQLRDRAATVPYFQVLGETVWGATAMVLSELLAVLETIPADLAVTPDLFRDGTVP